jgi:predicted RNA-binding Zn ribbon-like protein
MGEYFKAAFLLPLNLVGVAAFGFLGFIVPYLWLPGIGLEAAALLLLATNRRFQIFVDGKRLQAAAEAAEVQRRVLIRTLPLNLQQRLIELRRRSEKVVEVGEHAGELLPASNRETLDRLEWVYLKLLIAKNNLAAAGTTDSVQSLTAQIAEIEAGLNAPSASESLRQSRIATQTILKERLANIQRRKETLDEVNSDLTRIEAQVELMLGNATMQGKPITLSTDIELESNLTAANLYGESGGVVADLDRALGGLPAREPLKN